MRTIPRLALHALVSATIAAVTAALVIAAPAQATGPAGPAPLVAAVDPAGAAAASQGQLLGADETEQLLSFFNEYGVDEATQKRLIAKLQGAELWDSMKPGTSPAREETFRDGWYEVTISTYPDGSIAVSKAPALPEDASMGGQGYASPMNVSGCSVHSSPPYAVYYNNCWAEVDLGLIMMAFEFDYRHVTSQGYRITGWCCRDHRLIGPGASISNHRIERRSATKVRYSADVTACAAGICSNWVAWMQANVGTSGAWTTHN